MAITGRDSATANFTVKIAARPQTHWAAKSGAPRKYCATPKAGLQLREAEMVEGASICRDDSLEGLFYYKNLFV